MEINLYTINDAHRQDSIKQSLPSVQDQKQIKDMFDIQNQYSKNIRTLSQTQVKIRNAIQSMCFQASITILALISLFSDDIRTAAFDASADLAFDIMHLILMAIFLVEIILMYYSIPEYQCSFFFFLDIISSLSLLLDVTLITSLMYTDNEGTYDLTSLAAQTRASRVATRAIRIVKLVRIIRVIKMYKAASQTSQLKEIMKKKKLEQRMRQQLVSRNRKEEMSTFQKFNAQKREDGLDMEEQTKRFFQVSTIMENKKDHDDLVFDSEMIQEFTRRQSTISKVLTDLTIKKIVIVVLLIMFLVPLFESANYIQRPDSWDYTLRNLHQLLQNANISIEDINTLIKQSIANRQSDNYLIYFSSPFNQVIHYQLPDDIKGGRVQQIAISLEEVETKKLLSLRKQLTLRQADKQIDKNVIKSMFYYRGNARTGALFSIAKTLFVCITLIGMLHFFTDDINKLIVRPSEKMMHHVMEIARNPQVAVSRQYEDGKYQTTLVHNAIIKIGALLSLVFGSAGAQIIGSNIMKEGDVNPLIGGKKKCAIFGFCDIRNFTQITEILQEDIMIFVNKIGTLIHSSVFRYGGSANKNIGQAFLLVWKLPDDTYKINNQTNEITWKKPDVVSLSSDYSVYGFIKAIIKIYKDKSILEFREDQRLKKAFRNQFKVSMGFGLHIGWAIEGAIGSQYKIDASYLSPNVNMASRLEAATRQYGVDLLFSQNLFNMLSSGLQKFCRNIDRVTVKGSEKPIRLYTIDLNLSKISPSGDKSKKYKHPQDQLDIEIKKQINMKKFEEDQIYFYDAERFIKSKKEFREVMINSISQEFLSLFENGKECYLNGDWAAANQHLMKALKICDQDGPTHNLVGYMQKFQGVAPASWKKYRPLTSK